MTTEYELEEVEVSPRIFFFPDGRFEIQPRGQPRRLAQAATLADAEEELREADIDALHADLAALEAQESGSPAPRPAALTPAAAPANPSGAVESEVRKKRRQAEPKPSQAASAPKSPGQPTAGSKSSALPGHDAESLRPTQAAPAQADALRSGIYTAGQLEGSEIPPNREAVRGLLAEKKPVILGGDFGVGKSALTMQLGMSLASEEPFSGREMSRAYRIGYFDLELGAADARARMEELKKRFTNREAIEQNFHYIDCTFSSPLAGKVSFSAQGFEEVSRIVRERGLEFLIFDNLSLGFEGDETKSYYATEFIQRLHKFLAGHPGVLGILFVHHTSKWTDNAKGPMPSLLTSAHRWLSRIRGSGKLLDHFPTRLGLAKESDKSGAEFSVLGGIASHALVSPVCLEQDPDSRYFFLHPDQDLKARKVFSKAELTIWTRLAPKFTWNQVTGIAGKSKGTGCRMLEKAKANGLVEAPLSGDNQWRKAV